MQLWTIQAPYIWKTLQYEKVLRTTREHVVRSWRSDYTRPAYNWLREQMSERIGPPPQVDIHPIWAYFQFSDVKRRRPDLRTVRSWHPRGEQGLLLGLRVNASRVLLSDYETWHFVLNDWYVPLNEEDSQAFDRANYPEEVARALKIESWQRCLDLDFYAPNYFAHRDEKTIQATFWELYLEDVVHVREFVGTGNPSRFQQAGTTPCQT